MKLPVYSLFILECNALIFSLVRVAFYLTLIGVNRPFARWRHYTTTTRIIFVFPFIFPFIFKFDNLSEVSITKALICTRTAKS